MIIFVQNERMDVTISFFKKRFYVFIYLRDRTRKQGAGEGQRERDKETLC